MKSYKEILDKANFNDPKNFIKCCSDHNYSEITNDLRIELEELNEAFKAGPGQYGGFGLFTNTKVLKRLAIQGKMGSVVGSSKGEFAWDPKVGGLITKVVSYNEEGAAVGTNANGGNMADYVVPNPTKNMANKINI